MRILITGITGQLGKSLIDIKPENHEIIAPKREDLDLSNSKDCENIIKTTKPDWLINCGAYTNVDLAETEEKTAMCVNYEAPKAFAQEIKNTGGRFLQISTDYVFDGRQKNLPYSMSGSVKIPVFIGFFDKYTS